MRELGDAPFVQAMARCCTEMYAQGWDERNGGNISLLLNDGEVDGALAAAPVLRRSPIGFSVPELAGRCLLVTGTGQYFKNVERDPAAALGLVRIGPAGDTAELLWGFRDGGSVTSEFAAHLMSHSVRSALSPDHRVVMHCHPNHLLAMSFVHDLDERELTRTLWQMCSECIMVFPDGINVLPWMLCGTREIGRATAEKLRTARLVLWAQHGIYAAGASLDETYGLIETAEKAAAVYLMIAHLPWKQTISDDGLRAIAAHCGLTPRPGWLD